MNPLLSSTILVLIFVTALVIVLNAGLPAVDTAKATAGLRDAERTMKFIDNAVAEVSEEGYGSRRIISNSSAEFLTIPEEDAVQYETVSPAELFEYFSRKVIGNIVRISGNDVRCDDSANLTLENSFMRIEFQKVARVSPLAAIDTTNNILSIKEKIYNTIVYPANSSIVIDGDNSSSSGVGYSEILRKGTSLPECTIHFYINSTVNYDIFYKLYAGADFLVVDVRDAS